MRKRRIVLSLGVVSLLGAAVAMAAATARPAQGLPSYKSVCSSCHSGAPVGSVVATPSKTSLAPGERYSVNVAVDLSASGKVGFWIVSDGAGTPDPNLGGGPGSSPMSATLTAPTAPGVHRYKVYGVKGTPSASQTGTTTYSITVAAAATPTPTPTQTPTATPTPTLTADTAPPVTSAPRAATVRRGRVVTLRYQVNDPSPTSGTATVVVVIRSKVGKVVKTLHPGSASLNAPRSLRYRVKLKRGTYVFTVTATDAVGNASTVNGSNKLVVKRAPRADD